MDLQHRLSSAAVVSRQHLEIYKDKLADTRGFIIIIILLLLV